MKDTVYLLSIAVLSFFLHRQCNKPVETVRVPVRLDINLPENQGQFDTIYQDSIVIRTVTVPDKSDSLMLAYLNDSINRLNMFLEAISIREYNEIFSDSIQSISVYSKTRGHLIEQSILYNIFPQTIQIDTVMDIECPIPTQKYISLGAGYNPMFNRASLHAGFTYISTKKNMYQIGASSVGDIHFKFGIQF